jgi:hypothetical protein
LLKFQFYNRFYPPKSDFPEKGTVVFLGRETACNLWATGEQPRSFGKPLLEQIAMVATVDVDRLVELMG